MNYKFGKEESVIIGGIAVMLMMAMHLFSHPEWYSPEVTWSSLLGPIGNGLTKLISRSGGICVQIFALISGYALYKNTKAFSSWHLRLKRIYKFIFVYWLVYFFILIVAYFNNDTLPGTKEFILNILSINSSSNAVKVTFGWYVTFYIEFVLLTPAIIYLISRNPKLLDILIFCSVIILSFLCIRNPFEGVLNTLIYRLHPLMYVFLGAFSAKYYIFEKIHNKIYKNIPGFFFLLFFLLMFCIRYELTDFNKFGGRNWQFFILLCDGFIGLILVSFQLEIINRASNKKIYNYISFVGNFGLYIWLVHSIFFTGKNFLQKEIFFIKEPILIFFLCLSITFIISYLLYYVNNFLVSNKFKIFKRAIKYDS